MNHDFSDGGSYRSNASSMARSVVLDDSILVGLESPIPPYPRRRSVRMVNAEGDNVHERAVTPHNYSPIAEPIVAAAGGGTQQVPPSILKASSQLVGGVAVTGGREALVATPPPTQVRAGGPKTPRRGAGPRQVFSGDVTPYVRRLETEQAQRDADEARRKAEAQEASRRQAEAQEEEQRRKVAVEAAKQATDAEEQRRADAIRKRTANAAGAAPRPTGQQARSGAADDTTSPPRGRCTALRTVDKALALPLETPRQVGRGRYHDVVDVEHEDDSHHVDRAVAPLAAADAKKKKRVKVVPQASRGRRRRAPSTEEEDSALEEDAGDDDGDWSGHEREAGARNAKSSAKTIVRRLAVAVAPLPSSSALDVTKRPFSSATAAVPRPPPSATAAAAGHSMSMPREPVIVRRRTLRLAAPSEAQWEDIVPQPPPPPHQPREGAAPPIVVENDEDDATPQRPSYGARPPADALGALIRSQALSQRDSLNDAAKAAAVSSKIGYDLGDRGRGTKATKEAPTDHKSSRKRGRAADVMLEADEWLNMGENFPPSRTTARRDASMPLVAATAHSTTATRRAHPTATHRATHHNAADPLAAFFRAAFPDSLVLPSTSLSRSASAGGLSRALSLPTAISRRRAAPGLRI